MKKVHAISLKLAFLLLLFAGLLKTHDVKGCHFAAADIYVTYIGTGADGCGVPDYQYEITLKVYHACQTCFLDAGQTVPVYYSSADAILAGVTGANGQINVTSAPAPDTSHSLCEQFIDSMSCRAVNGRILASRAANFPAFRVREYTGTVTLPSAQKDWRFFWSNGGRNTSFNLNMSTCGSIYVEAGLNNLTKYNNSTPRFESNPLPYICVNQPNTYLNIPYDPNGDSLSVYQQTPFTPGGAGVNNIGNPCSYAAGYSNNDPIGSAGSNPYKLNRTTGSATFTPTLQGFAVLAFRVEDYEKGTGERLSYVYRDVQVSVLPCTSPQPDIDSLKQVISSIKDGTIVSTPDQGNVVYVCPGSKLEFSLNSSVADATHNVYMYNLNPTLFPGSNFTVAGQGSSSVTGTFTWTPTQSDLGDHNLVLESRDSTCTVGLPIVLKSKTSIQIRVTDGLDAGPDLPTCAVNTDSTQLFVRNTEFLRLKWTLNGGPAIGISNDTIHNPKVFTKVQADYVVNTPDLVGTCKSRDTVTIFVDETNNVQISPKNPTDAANALVMCRPGYLQLEALLTGRPPKNNVSCGTGSPTVCSSPETKTVYGSSLYGKLEYDSVGRVTPIFNNIIRSTRFQYLIRKDEMNDAEVFSATIRGLGFETQGNTNNAAYEYSNFRIFIKCTDKNELDPTDGFENFGMTQVYFSQTETLADGEHMYNFSVPYNWDTTKNLIVQICYADNQTVETGCGVNSTPPRLSYSPTTYVSALSLQASTSTVQSVCGIDKASDIGAFLARPAFRFRYCEADPLDYLVTWNRSEYLSDTTILQPLAYVPKSTSFIAQAVGRSTCIMRDTLDVYIPEHDFKVLPEDTAICLGDKTPFTVYGGHYFKWYEYEDGQYVDPLTTRSIDNPKNNYTFISPTKTTDYRIVVSDSVWCYDTLAVKVKILPLPDVRILNEDDTVVRYGQQFQLLASGAKLYNWSPVSSLNNPNISYPMARLTEDTKYIVGGIGSNGCRAFDTLHVIVDKKDNLFVPSAFSPNGDGKNDLFRVTNLSFQRIMEFRVFNRWGQEVYSTNDSRAGWDGTFEGKPQDMGTYSYLIRVAYPDGFVETYRGETTLIR